MANTQSSSEDREKAFLSTLDHLKGKKMGPGTESPLCNLACVSAPYTALLSILAELAVFYTVKKTFIF